MEQKLSEIVDVFSCCIFTPRILTTVLPAFLLAGAIAAFVPRAAVLYYLGPRAARSAAYGVSALSGCLLSLCSCNVVPLFLSIYRQGAGLGPAFAFLYAGPAINVVSLIMVFKVIGWRIGIWRALGVPVLSILVGAIMARLFRREEEERVQALAATGPTWADGGGPTLPQGLRPALVILALLLAFVIAGSVEIPWDWRAVVMTALLAIAVAMAWQLAGPERLVDWASETWAFFKLVMPVLVPVILLIGLVAAYMDVKWVYWLVGSNDPRSILFASLFGALMYFPILSEIAFAKAFLKLGMASGPALAILLTGPGVSLPGAVVLGRVIGWRKTIVYLGLVVTLATLTAIFFSSEVGQYLCPCIMGTK
jgi:uncharacterized membrane protein YraQ (UPF0718 family)